MKFLLNILVVTLSIFGALSLPTSAGGKQLSKESISTLSRHAVYADAAYCPRLLGEVCSARYRKEEMSYLSKQQLGWLDELKVMHHFYFKPAKLYAYIGYSKKYKEVVLGFKGTSFTSFKSVTVNVRQTLVKYKYPDQKSTGSSNYMVHQGYSSAFSGLARSTLIKLEQLAKANIPGSGYKLVIVGHSQGGAVASVAAMEIKKAYQLQKPIISKLRAKIPSSHIFLHTFAQPRIGNKDFANLVHSVIGVNNVARVTNYWDLVPSLPSLKDSYFHHPNEIFITGKHKVVRCKDVANGKAIEDASCSAAARVLALYMCSDSNAGVCSEALRSQFEEHRLSQYVKYLGAAAN
ncbi:alpha/beta-hydrolase [Basidiobolus meristosporus CBS 931.73]|uniref:Alpha/beta-hydrolase n=1 Tax=Basidiobolus meristosporus CBS 931.73 TaxID=1314790 RepID=A0A1Y1Z6A5_9FUNG|nr:alpha/beta-hydrolase [Basidiobolus meristosporus CBS 931.73]|eukprot:ORY05789.1 alpha/beta-hydrolase [Basidiobolus meristosporus CBS 931.73]